MKNLFKNYILFLTFFLFKAMYMFIFQICKTKMIIVQGYIQSQLSIMMIHNEIGLIRYTLKYNPTHRKSISTSILSYNKH